MRILKRVLLAVVLAGLVALAGYHIRQGYEEKATTKKKGPAVRVVSVGAGTARVGQVKEEIVLTGALKPKEQVDITAKTTGRVTRIHVYVGDQVRTGQLLAEMEDDELKQQVNRAIAARSVAIASHAQREAELKNSQADLDRAQTLFREGLIPRQDLEARQTAYQVMQAQVQLAQAQQKQAEAELNELRIRLEQTKVYAPLSGLVARRFVDEGAMVGPAVPILSLMNLSVMIVAANVPEREVAKLRVGNTTTMRVDAFGDRVFKGVVARVAPVLDAATRTATVEVEVANPDGGLKAEMFARITLDLASTRPTVLIPRDALVYRGTQPGVFVLQGDRPLFRPIETGLATGEDVEVLSNLNPGTEIVTRGASMLAEGDRIRVGDPDGARQADGEQKGKKKQTPAANTSSPESSIGVQPASIAGT